MENIVQYIFVSHVIGMFLTLVSIISLDIFCDTNIMFDSDELTMFIMVVFWEFALVYYLLKVIFKCIKNIIVKCIKLIPESNKHRLKRIEDSIKVEMIYNDSKYIEGFNANDKYAYYYQYDVLAKIKLKEFKREQIGTVKDMLVKKCNEYIDNSDTVKKNIINGIKLK
ncbi:MAG: hypothetical protein ACM3O3_12915 [Syntrophothermus sp.]